MLKQLVIYIGIFITFCVVALFYFKPVLNGDKIFQSDIAQFRGMSKELNDFREINGKEAFWTNAAFGGMPSYQLSTYYPHNYIKTLDSLVRFLPRPADYLFLYFLGFFVLLTVLKFDWKLALIGSLAFGFSTYFIIILGVGHNAKAHAIGYMPLVLAGLLLLFQHKYLIGFVLTAIAMGLEIQTSHPQMTYYLAFLLVFVGIFYLVEQVQKGIVQKAIKPISYAIIAMFIGLLMNAQSLLATKEYADHSTRSKSELTINPDGSSKEASLGLSKEYITQYSYGILETLNLMVPRLTGGANSENLGKDSNTYRFLAPKIGARQAASFSENVPTYWGSQPIVAAPAYIGVVFVLFFFIGAFLLKGWLKKALIAATVFSILLSWGKNLGFLTNFFIDYMPLYNKFRAVSSIQVLAEVCVPLLGMLALKELLSSAIAKEDKMIAIKKGGVITAGIILVFGFLGSFFYSYIGANDGYYNQQIPGFIGALQADRKAILIADSFRSITLVAISVGVILAVLSLKLKKQYGVLILGLVLLFDTMTVAKRYVNDDDFLPAEKVEKPFAETTIDKQIRKDKSHYRVVNLAGNFMNDGATSYYHKSIGGYHAAKLRRYQELVDFQLSQNNMEVFNMLHTKYFITPNEQGGKEVQLNPETNGNAWFATNIIEVDNANEEILALSNFNSKKDVVVNTNEFSVESVEQDETAVVKLTSYNANELTYTYQSDSSQLLVFSEIYYQPGWNAYIDGVFTPHFRANYVLRAMNVPKGIHTIAFKFEPTVIQKGSMISLLGYGLLALLSGVLVFMPLKKKE